ncbi:MAG: hypothetical protein ABIH66_10895 [bacterium]
MKIRFVILAVMMVFLVGCKDEIDTAIGKLGGTTAEQQQAISDIAISGKDPLPKLRKALKDRKLPAKTRAAVAKLLGTECEKAGDPSRCSTEELKGALADAESEEVVQAVVSALAVGKSKEGIAALREALDSDSAVASAAAAAELGGMADEKVLKAEVITDPAAFSRKEELLREAVELNPRNRKVVGILASLYSSQGMAEEARELFDTAGEFVRSFMVLGPFPPETPIPFSPGEEIDFGAAYPGKRREAVWFGFDNVPESGEADFRRDRRTMVADAAYYATFTAKSGKAQEVLLTVLGSDVDAIWLNGKKLKYKPPAEENGAESRVAMALEKGANRFLIRVGSRKYSRFAVRLSDRKHNKLKGVEYGF